MPTEKKEFFMEQLNLIVRMINDYGAVNKTDLPNQPGRITANKKSSAQRIGLKAL